MRELKFRAYAPNAEGDKMLYFTLDDFINGKLNLWWFTKYKPTIDRFTGLKDKNGVEIYEGDIVEYPYYGNNDPTTKSQVNFKDGAFRIGGSDIRVYAEKCESIGNIYENPALLS